jgi:cyclopropane-fatty-acyl-phospholipid synthase
MARSSGRSRRMRPMLLPILVSRLITYGTLEVIHADGRRTRSGDRRLPHYTVRLHERRLDWWLALNPELHIAEAYVDGTLTIEDADLREFLAFVGQNLQRYDQTQRRRPLQRVLRRLTRQRNPVGRARRNVAHHYDLSGQLYDLFLDSDRQYSCAYFTSPDVSLEQAQYDKKIHLASKLLLDRPGLRVLEIGSGWGGLGLYLAGETGADVTGVTLSVEQHKLSQERARAQGLSRRCRFHLRDYRHEQGQYDRIVSVGMFEHVGKRNYDEFFRKVAELLTDDGVCLLHSIGRFDEPSPINPFIRKYIFPGADIPSLSEVTAAIERAGLLVTDLEVLRLHYAETLRHWYQRVEANHERIVALYDERFYRMWTLYLASCEMGFRHQGLMVFQVQLAKRVDAVPLTRDYMLDWERERRADQRIAAE